MLAPGVRRLRPDDHFMIVAETDASPMHVGALLFLDVPEADRPGLRERIARQIAERLPATPLLCRLVASPEGYDSDAWAELAGCDLDYHVAAMRLEDGGEAAIQTFVATCSMERLDLARPPFRLFVLDGLADGRSVLYLKMHHSIADGIGFQAVLALLSDAQPPMPPRAQDAIVPKGAEWRALAEARFVELADAAEAHRRGRREAKAGLGALKAQGEPDRSVTPVLAMSNPTSPKRSYATLSLPLAEIKALGAALDATVNHIFLALAGTALRHYLIEVGDLPALPIVANSARSYRRPDHGAFGNRIVALHPHLATHLADPIERLRAIQAEMARELRRTAFDEALLDAPEAPYGSRERRARLTERLAGSARLLPGNVTLSNVPGPAEALSYAGYRVTGNFPVPILGSGRFLNVTSRRNADRLDMGIMTDARKIPDATRIAHALEAAVEEYRHAAG